MLHTYNIRTQQIVLWIIFAWNIQEKDMIFDISQGIIFSQPILTFIVLRTRIFAHGWHVLIFENIYRIGHFINSKHPETNFTLMHI
jgi:hypothetical protein